jgi:hypothetical protein
MEATQTWLEHGTLTESLDAAVMKGLRGTTAHLELALLELIRLQVTLIYTHAPTRACAIRQQEGVNAFLAGEARMAVEAWGLIMIVDIDSSLETYLFVW